MWSNTLAVFLAIANFDAGQAISLHKRDTPTVVSLDITRTHVSDPVARDLRRRSMTVLESLENEVSYSAPWSLCLAVFAVTDEDIRKGYISPMSH